MRLASVILILVLTSGLAAEEVVVPVKVTIDEHNRLFLNGEPWFPLCLSPTPPPFEAKDHHGRDAFQTLAKGGIDSFRIGLDRWSDYEETCAKYLDVLAPHKMYGFVYLKEFSVFDDRAPARRERLDKMVERFRSHPALALWKNKDEPAWGPNPVPVDGMIQAYNRIRELDPHHPVWLTHAPRNTVEEWREYCKACDIVAVDIYPVSVPMGKNSHLPNKNLSVVGDYAEMANLAVDGRKPLFMVLQVGWSGILPPKHERVFPTLHQERYMTYQSIIKGARGLLFFGMSVALDGQDAELGYNWTFWDEVLEPLLREIRKGSELYPALTVPDSTLPLEVTGASDIECVCREVGDFLYILAAKREDEPAEVRFSGDFMTDGEAEVVYENRKVKITDGSFCDHFGRNDVHVYKFRPK